MKSIIENIQPINNIKNSMLSLDLNDNNDNEQSKSNLNYSKELTDYHNNLKLCKSINCKSVFHKMCYFNSEYCYICTIKNTFIGMSFVSVVIDPFIIDHSKFSCINKLININTNIYNQIINKLYYNFNLFSIKLPNLVKLNNEIYSNFFDNNMDDNLSNQLINNKFKKIINKSTKLNGIKDFTFPNEYCKFSINKNFYLIHKNKTMPFNLTHLLDNNQNKNIISFKSNINNSGNRYLIAILLSSKQNSILNNLTSNNVLNKHNNINIISNKLKYSLLNSSFNKQYNLSVTNAIHEKLKLNKDYFNLDNTIDIAKDSFLNDIKNSCILDKTRMLKIIKDLNIYKEEISLKCAITQKLLDIPVRGYNCMHINCFEYFDYIKINSINLKWKCPICNKLTYFDQLEYDTSILRLLILLKDNIKIIDNLFDEEESFDVKDNNLNDANNFNLVNIYSTIFTNGQIQVTEIYKDQSSYLYNAFNIIQSLEYYCLSYNDFKENYSSSEDIITDKIDSDNNNQKIAKKSWKNIQNDSYLNNKNFINKTVYISKDVEYMIESYISIITSSELDEYTEYLKLMESEILANKSVYNFLLFLKKSLLIDTKNISKKIIDIKDKESSIFTKYNKFFTNNIDVLLKKNINNMLNILKKIIIKNAINQKFIIYLLIYVYSNFISYLKINWNIVINYFNIDNYNINNRQDKINIILKNINKKEIFSFCKIKSINLIKDIAYVLIDINDYLSLKPFQLLELTISLILCLTNSIQYYRNTSENNLLSITNNLKSNSLCKICINTNEEFYLRLKDYYEIFINTIDTTDLITEILQVILLKIDNKLDLKKSKVFVMYTLRLFPDYLFNKKYKFVYSNEYKSIKLKFLYSSTFFGKLINKLIIQILKNKLVINENSSFNFLKEDSCFNNVVELFRYFFNITDNLNIFTDKCDLNLINNNKKACYNIASKNFYINNLSLYSFFKEYFISNFNKLAFTLNYNINKNTIDRINTQIKFIFYSIWDNNNVFKFLCNKE